jgi:serine/threonine protein kinase
MGLASSLAPAAPCAPWDVPVRTPPLPGAGFDTPPGSPRYRPLRLLGRGGSATVWRVHDLLLSRDVAMKVLHAAPASASDEPDLAAEARLLGEARLTGALGLPGVVAVHDAGRLPDGRCFFTMQCVDGPTLADAIDAREAGANDALGTRTLVTVLAGIARTLAAVHARGLAHRDVKPANILIGPAGEAFLADWGLGGPSGRWAGGAASGPDEALSGTLHYMAPEQFEGDGRHQGPVSDVYGLGVCLFEVLTGTTPHQGTSALGLIFQIRTVDAPDPRTLSRSLRADVPAALASLCGHALTRDPAQRAVTAGAFAERLERWLAAG